MARECAGGQSAQGGGTTHPYAALRHLVPGHYDASTGAWRADSGGTRCYSSTDNLVDPAWLGVEPASVIEAVRDAGLQFSPATGRGVVLHMLSCLAIDGRLGLTSIAPTLDEAHRAADGVRRAIDGLAHLPSGPRRSGRAPLQHLESVAEQA